MGSYTPIGDAARSVDQIEEGTYRAVLGADEVAIIGRGDIVVNVARILMVGDVVNAKGSTELVIFHPRQKRDAKVLGQFEIEGKKGRKAKAVGLAHIILQIIDR